MPKLLREQSDARYFLQLNTFDRVLNVRSPIEAMQDAAEDVNLAKK